MEFIAILTQIQRNLSALAYQPRPEVVYFLDAVTPYAQVTYPDGRTFKIRQDGTTTANIAGLDLPCPCPYPDAIWRLNTAVFVRRHRKYLPLAIVGLIALASLQLLVAAIPGAPGAAWFVDYFAAAMNAVLLTLALLCIVAFALHNFGRGIEVRFSQPDTDAPLLTAGQLDISPDVLVVSTSDSEQPDTFARRVRDATLDQLPAGQYILILTFRCPAGIIVRCPDLSGQSQEYFERANLTRTIPGWTQEVCEPCRFDRETWADFSAYVRAFCEQFRVWSQTDKMKQGANPLKSFVETMEAAARKAAVTALILFCAFSANAQGELKPISARPMPENSGQSIFKNVPDSMKLEKLKQEMLESKFEIGREIAPRQMFLMWTFHNWVVPVMFLFGLLAWFWAKAAFRESEHDQGGNVIFGIGIANGGHYARRIVFILAAAIAVVEIADSVIWAFFREQNMWWAAIKCVSLAVLWMYLVNWITPNPRKADIVPQGQGGVSFPTTRQIGSGR